MVNINKLKGKIVENGLTVEVLAEKMGIDRSTLYRKISSNGEDFTIKDANMICKALNLSIKEATSIFLARMSHGMRVTPYHSARPRRRPCRWRAFL